MHDEWDVAEGTDVEPVCRILLYSDHPQIREAVLLGVGTRAAKDLPRIEWVEVATPAMALERAMSEKFDLLVLDGEAGKAGGMGLCRQLKDEVFRCPPVLLLLGRREDAWLASWTEAEAFLARPLDPIELQDTVARLLRVPVEGSR
jgi:DNA-binding response OmpR family regulator